MPTWFGYIICSLHLSDYLTSAFQSRGHLGSHAACSCLMGPAARFNSTPSSFASIGGSSSKSSDPNLPATSHTAFYCEQTTSLQIPFLPHMPKLHLLRFHHVGPDFHRPDQLQKTHKLIKSQSKQHRLQLLPYPVCPNGPVKLGHTGQGLVATGNWPKLMRSEISK